tara:strand:+ start:3078 stop:3761 length:684 start_codon:yes stop_codon:yes gene_type:complete
MKTISSKIKNILLNGNNKYLTIGNIIKSFEKDSFFIILFFSTFITSIPSPSYGFGTSTMIGGLISLLVAIQLLFNLKKLYLPEFILKKKIKLKKIKKKEKIINKILDTFELLLKKNNESLLTFFFVKISTLLIIFNSILMIFPLILTNWLPSTTITLLSISYLFKDGRFFLFSLFFSLFVSIAYITIFRLIFLFFKKSNNYYESIKQIYNYDNIMQFFREKIKPVFQ